VRRGWQFTGGLLLQGGEFVEVGGEEAGRLEMPDDILRYRPGEAKAIEGAGGGRARV